MKKLPPIEVAALLIILSSLLMAACVYTKSATNTQAPVMSKIEALGQQPAWSPDGTKIAALESSSGNIIILDVEELFADKHFDPQQCHQ